MLIFPWGSPSDAVFMACVAICKLQVKFLFIAISGIYLRVFEGSHGSQQAVPEPMHQPTMTQARREHTTQLCIRLVHVDALRIVPQSLFLS